MTTNLVLTGFQRGLSATSKLLSTLYAGVLIWRYGTTAGAITTKSGVKHKFSGASTPYKVCINSFV